MKDKFKRSAAVVADRFKAVDRYSRIITFSFEGKESFGTLLGGFVSVITYVVLFIYAYVVLRIMFERKGTVFKNVITKLYYKK